MLGAFELKVRHLTLDHPCVRAHGAWWQQLGRHVSQHPLIQGSLLLGCDHLKLRHRVTHEPVAFVFESSELGQLRPRVLEALQPLHGAIEILGGLMGIYSQAVPPWPTF